jgi:hypothetical protein
MVGVLLSGYSAYLSYTYLVKVKGEGLDILQGWTQLKAFNEHLLINFAGAAATVLALQAEVGTMMVGGMTKSAGSLGLAALAQVRGAVFGVSVYLLVAAGAACAYACL